MVRSALQWFLAFGRRYWVGAVLILLATLIYFWPMVVRISSYSEGGDAMFNAWTLARNHHCLTFDGCPTYADGNIFFPHQDSMFYSEAQLSAGFLTLPLYWINDNPIFSYNVWTIASFFFSGWFMYLLAKRLSRGNEIVSVLAGLIFEFAPFKIAAVTHLQSLSIFYLPLAVLLLLRFFDSARKRYMAGFFVVMTLLFYASWYQSVFALLGIGVLLGVLWVGRQIDRRHVLYTAAAIVAAGILVLPLALQYLHFSKTNNATFSISEQVGLSSSVYDYILPNYGTLLGKVYYHFPHSGKANAYNPDSFSYHGISLYALLTVLLAITGVTYYRIRRARPARPAGDHADRRTQFAFMASFAAIAFVGFVVSLGPLLKWRAVGEYGWLGGDLHVVVPLPWLAVDLLLPQLQFIRAIGRASVLTLFALSCAVAYLPVVLNGIRIRPVLRRGIVAVVAVLVVFELMPAHRVFMTSGAYAYNIRVPQVYKLVKSSPDINNLVILRSDPDYPGAPFPVARTEDVLWAGYHNKNIYNGYSGYTPPRYFEEYADMVDLQANDVPAMKRIGLRYVVVDKQLSSDGQLAAAARQLLPQKIYEDGRYILFKL